MAMNVGARRGGAIAEINVTPMADVMIVLLIIFMVMTPLITASVPLPKAANAQPRQKEAGIEIVMTRSGEIRTGGRVIESVSALRADVQEQLAASAEGQGFVMVKADRDLAYSEVERVLDACRQAGAEEVGLAAERKIG
jgi:biopolymer transport protein TolR